MMISLYAGKEMLEIYKYKDFNFEDQSLFWNNIKNYFEKKKKLFI